MTTFRTICRCGVSRHGDDPKYVGSVPPGTLITDCEPHTSPRLEGWWQGYVTVGDCDQLSPGPHTLTDRLVVAFVPDDHAVEVKP